MVTNGNIVCEKKRSNGQQNEKKVHQQIAPPDSPTHDDKHHRIDGAQKASRTYQDNNHCRNKQDCKGKEQQPHSHSCKLDHFPNSECYENKNCELFKDN